MLGATLPAAHATELLARLSWSEVLRTLRAARGVTQDGWAASLGYSTKTVQRWERGTAAPDAAAQQAIVALCQAKGLLRSYYQGPLAGVTVTAELLHELLAGARLAAPTPDASRQPPDDVSSQPAAGAPAAARSNLPCALTSFVGREAALTEIRRLLATARLLTLSGAGGVGKTRLALEVGRALAAAAPGEPPRYPDGVWLAELAPLSDPTLVPDVVASALGIRQEPGRSFLDTLVSQLKARHLLLLLDNCEHLVDACAQLAGTLLRACPTLTILTTSREALRLTGETVYRVPPLTLPDAGRPLPVTDLTRFEAARLFVERATAVSPDFVVTEQNVAAVAQVCWRLDGIPLALELAAARVGLLSVEQIAARLDDRFRLLTSGCRTALPRQQTLRGVIDWSYELLSERERALFNRLAVFAGGFTLEAAEVVCGEWEPPRGSTAQAGTEELGSPSASLLPSADILDSLARLVDKSLVLREEPTASHPAWVPRYRLLETVRAYAEERLAGAGEVAATQERHLAYYLALAHREEGRQVGPEQPAALAQLALEIDNLRAALGHALADGDAEPAGELAIRIWRFWLVSGRAAEGRDWIARTLAAGTRLPRSSRARLLDAAGALAHSQGDYAESQARHEESLEIWRALGELTGIAAAVASLGLVLKGRGDLDGAAARLEEALTVCRAAGQDVRVAMLLNNLAAVAMDQGDFARADRFQEESLAIKRRTGDQAGIASSLYNLAETARYRGEYERAELLCGESLALCRRLGLKPDLACSLHLAGSIATRLGRQERAVTLLSESLALFQELGIHWGVPFCLEALAEAAVARGDAQTAVRLLGAAADIREEIGAPLPPADRPAVEETLTAARAALSEEAFTVLWEAGRALTIEQAIRAALTAVP